MTTRKIEIIIEGSEISVATNSVTEIELLGIIEVLRVRTVVNITKRAEAQEQERRKPKLAMVRVTHDGKQTEYNLHGQFQDSRTDLLPDQIINSTIPELIYNDLIKLGFTGIVMFTVFSRSGNMDNKQIDYAIENNKPVQLNELP